MKNYILTLILSTIFISCSVKETPKIINLSKIRKVETKIVEEETREISQPKIDESKEKITILYSSNRIGKYAINASNTVIGYLATKNDDFNLKIIDMPNESFQSFKKALEEIKNDNRRRIIAIITNASYDKIIRVPNINEFDIFLPLIHKNNTIIHKKNFIYGGVDYKQQFKELIKYSNDNDISLFDNSYIGRTLNNYLSSVNNSLIFKKQINNNNAFLGSLFKKHAKIFYNSSVFLNTPIVKSSIILSQLRANELEMSNILSTQLNYTPLILSLTQIQDRKNLIIANSIGYIDYILRENISLLKSDIKYDWLNYATLIGLDNFVNEEDDKINNNIIDNQVIYDINLIKTVGNTFVDVANDL